MEDVGSVLADSPELTVFDTDIGGDVDDALALAYLLREPRCRLVGVTTVGGSADLKAEIASAICRDLGRPDVAIHPGASRSILGGYRFEDSVPRYWPPVADYPHDSFRNENTALEFLQQTIADNPGEVTLVCTGHFTNVALLFAAHPGIPALLRRLVIMGGNFNAGAVEWNAMCDPVATAVAFGCGNVSHPPLVRVFPGNATGRDHLPPDEGRRFMAGIPALRFCAAAAEYWYREGHDLYFHDPVAAVGAFHPEIATYRRSGVTVDVASRGHVDYADEGADGSGPPLEIAQEIDFAKFAEIYLGVLR